MGLPARTENEMPRNASRKMSGGSVTVNSSKTFGDVYDDTSYRHPRKLKRFVGWLHGSR